jgi:hypothetical protein
MEKEFIPYEQALALKEFDGFGGNYRNSYFTYLDQISAPLYQQVFRWFREKTQKGFHNSKKKRNKMEEQDYKQLEFLLGKLNTEIGNDKRIMVIPNYVHDGYAIGVYEGGVLTDQYVGANIQSLVKKINSQMIMK